jgi:hypothetical protein
LLFVEIKVKFELIINGLIWLMADNRQLTTIIFMSFTAGDFLIFQVESGFGLLRVLDVETDEQGEKVWHVAAYADMFLDVEFADLALQNPENLQIAIPHAALTNRAFEATQVSKMSHETLKDSELQALNQWKADSQAVVGDRSIRLLLGLR